LDVEDGRWTGGLTRVQAQAIGLDPETEEVALSRNLQLEHDDRLT
jgi:hypothetical protein